MGSQEGVSPRLVTQNRLNNQRANACRWRHR